MKIDPLLMWEMQPEGFTCVFPFSPVSLCWVTCVAVGMLADPVSAAGRGRAGAVLLGLPGTWQGSPRGQLGARVPAPSLAALGSQRCAAHAQCLLASRKFWIVAGRLKTPC